MKKFYTLAMAAFATLAMNAQLYVVGNFNGENCWTPDAPTVAEKNAAGNWEITLPATSAFKVSTAMGDWDTFNGSSFSVNEGDITKDFMNAFFAVEPWGENTNLPWTGDWTLEVTADFSQMKLTTTTPEPQEATPAYIRGDMNGWGSDPMWLCTSPKLFEYTFECKGETIIEGGVPFKVADSNWGGVNYSVGFDADSEIIADGEENIAFYNKKNMFFTEDFEGLIRLELTNGYNKDGVIYFTPVSDGIDNVTVSNTAAAEYFNLQGVRVANPEAGSLYIVRRGNDVKKVIVK